MLSTMKVQKQVNPQTSGFVLFQNCLSVSVFTVHFRTRQIVQQHSSMKSVRSCHTTLNGRNRKTKTKSNNIWQKPSFISLIIGAVGLCGDLPSLPWQPLCIRQQAIVEQLTVKVHASFLAVHCCINHVCLFFWFSTLTKRDNIKKMTSTLSKIHLLWRTQWRSAHTAVLQSDEGDKWNLQSGM